MASFERDGVAIHFEEFGTGFPVLLFAPGGMRSSAEHWAKAPFDPRVELADDFWVIAMDQRNAGRSAAPIRARDGWDSYTSDHLALLDHLGIERCHLFGGCIGSSYSLGLIAAAPARVAAAVLQNPIGLHENRAAFYELFDGWAEDMKQRQDGLDDDALAPFRESMYGGDFVFNVGRAFVRSVQTPLLVLAGNDLYHPAPIAAEIAELAPNAELVTGWKEPAAVAATVEKVRDFLTANTAAPQGSLFAS
ncbi:MAG: alpha/beta hydrolase [Thermoanaerobaculia bacterium]|nr:alpha/beta hydrolase [Thermoanaerobaculia bacterium]